MKKAIIFASAAMIGVVLIFGPAGAQVAPQTVELAKVNVQKLAAGYRASKVIGSSVTNDCRPPYHLAERSHSNALQR